MKRKLLYIFSIAVISFTSTGFGFLESSTAVHRQANQTVKTDSVKINSVNISLNNTSIPQKGIHKSVNESITKTVIQWIAETVSKGVEKIVTYLADALQAIMYSILKLFTK